MKHLKRIASFILALCMLASMTQAFAINKNATVTFDVEGTFDYTMAYEVLDIVNQNRAKLGLSALTMDKDLMAAAMQRAAECSIYYDHTRPDGTSCFTAIPSKMAFGYHGENVAVGYTTADAVMNGWMNSSGHKANILGTNFTSIGIGCFYQDGVIYWAQLFTSSKGTAPSARPTNTETSVTIDALLSNTSLKLVYDTSADEDVCTYHLYNTNLEYTYSKIKLSCDSTHFASSNNYIAHIHDNGYTVYIHEGTFTLSAYIGDVLALEVEMPSIPHHIAGDIDSDGVITNADLVTMAQYIVNLPVREFNLAYADTDGDCKITNADAVADARRIVGLD